MLAYSQGGASSPAGATTQVQNAMSGYAHSASSTVGMMQSLAAVEQTKAGTDKLRAEAEQVRSQTMDQKLNTARLLAETRRLESEREVNVERVPNVRKDTELKGAQASSALASAVSSYSSADLNAVRQKLTELELTRGNATFSADVARRKAESLLAELEVPKSKAESSFYDSAVGKANPYLIQLLSILKGGSSAYRSLH